MARRAVLVFAIAAAVLTIPAAATAHPLGNFTVNVYAGLRLTPGELRMKYVVDMAEIPTLQLLAEIDANADGAVSASERSGWAAQEARDVRSNLALTLDGRSVSLNILSASMRLAPGQGGLDVLRLEAAFAAVTPERGGVVFSDANFADRMGWREVTAVGTDGVAIRAADVPDRSVTGALRSYPEDLLSSPLDVRGASFRFGPGEAPPAPEGSGDDDPIGSSGRSSQITDGVVASLVGRTGAFMLLGVLLAFGTGALHALGPGHGKTLMAAYLIGAGGRIRHAVAVGVSIAVMHTASVLGLGVAVLALTETFAPERLYPWLGLASGVVALALGVGLVGSRHATRRGATNAHGHGAHLHAHPHRHEAAAHPVSRSGMAALAFSGGLLPSPSALVVLLSAVATGRVAYGLTLIAAFSVGLASALVVVGVLALRARDAVASRMSSRLVRFMPVASASALAIVGIALTVRGLAQV